MFTFHRPQFTGKKHIEQNIELWLKWLFLSKRLLKERSLFDFTGSIGGRRNVDDFLELQLKSQNHIFAKNFVEKMSWNERLLKWRRRWWRRRQSLHRRRLSSTAAFRSPSKCEREEKVLQLAFVCVCLCGWVCGRIYEVEERVGEKERKRFALSLLHCTIISCSAINSISLSLSLSLSLLLSLSCYYFNSHSPRHMHTHTQSTHALSRFAFSLTHAWTYMQRYEHDKSPLSDTNTSTLMNFYRRTHSHAHTRAHIEAHTHTRTHTHVHTSRHTKAHTHSHSLSRAISVSFPFFIFSSDERNGWYESWKLSKIRIKSFLVVSSGPFFTRWTSAQIYPLDWSIIRWIDPLSVEFLPDMPKQIQSYFKVRRLAVPTAISQDNTKALPPTEACLKKSEDELLYYSLPS